MNDYIRLIDEEIEKNSSSRGNMMGAGISGRELSDLLVEYKVLCHLREKFVKHHNQPAYHNVDQFYSEDFINYR